MKIAVSGCLAGNNCRFDGRAKNDKFITENLNKNSEIITFCPENELLGSPRESMRLVSQNKNISVIGNKTSINYTEKLKTESEKLIKKFRKDEISAIVFKSKSPTCGISRVKVYSEDRSFLHGDGEGILAQAVKQEMPFLPIEDEGRLQDDWLRENFIMQMFAFNNFEKFRKNKSTNYDKLVKFHTSYKYLLLSKNEKIYREMGRIVANHEKLDFKTVLSQYEDNFKTAIAKKSNRKSVYNVLLHMHGFLKNHLTKTEKDEVLGIFEEFKNGVVPLITPISIIKIYSEKYNVEFLKQQVFLDPYPKDLALRSSVKAFK
jgi:uncharacterized protein YbgA (DUF1722 family)/uncharacterized protein YbbK (DUF523 family)